MNPFGRLKRHSIIKGCYVNLCLAASIEVDPQCGFSELCPKELPVPGALEIVPELNKQGMIAQLRVASRDAHPSESLWVATEGTPQFSPITGYKNLDVHWNRHCVVGTKGFRFLPGLEADSYEFIANKGIEPDKHPYGACYHDLADTQSTGLIEFLIAHNMETVIVGGLATSFCVKTTVLQLCKAGCFRVFVNLAACRDIAGIDTAASIKEMENAGAIMLKDADDIEIKVKM